MDLATDRGRSRDHAPSGPQEVQETDALERFTSAARLVGTSAVVIARDRGDSRVGTEHLLAGVSAASSRAADLLGQLGAGPEQLKTAISDLDRTALAAIGIDQDSVRLGPVANEWLRTKRHIPF